MNLPNLKIYKDKEGNNIGYDSKALAKWMKKHRYIGLWENWSMGSTGAIIDGHFVVYWWDVQSFLDGELNLD